MESRSALRTAIAAAVVGWLGLLDGCLSSRQVLERELDRAEHSLDSDVRGQQYQMAHDPTGEARASVTALAPALGGHSYAWVYGRGFLDFKGYNLVPWWLASTGQRERFAALTERIEELDALYRPDAKASAQILASIHAWIAANPTPTRLEKIPAAPKWILYADTTGALHPLHTRLRENVVGQTADAETYFAVPIKHTWTRVRSPSADPNDIAAMMRIRCYDAVDLLVGRTAPFEALGVVHLGRAPKDMAADFGAPAFDVSSLLAGNPSDAMARRLAALRLGVTPEAPITEPIDDPEGCTQIPPPMEATFGSWLN